MAVIQPTKDEPVGQGRESYLVTWVGLGNGDTGAWVSHPGYTDVSVVIDGTPSTGGSCTLEGSMDGSTGYALTDNNGAAIALTAAGTRLVDESLVHTRPNVTAGDGSTSFNVALKMTRPGAA